MKWSSNPQSKQTYKQKMKNKITKWTFVGVNLVKDKLNFKKFKE